MASHTHLDDEEDFGGDYPGTHSSRATGNKRSLGDLEDEDEDFFGSKKRNAKVEESVPGVTTGMILSLRESLQNSKDTLATYQTGLEAAKSEIQKWYSAFQNESAIPAGTTPEAGLVVNYLQNLKTSEESLRDQLEKAKKKEAAFIVTFAKRDQEIADLKAAVRDLKAQLKPPSMQARRLLLDPAIHEEFTRLKNLVEEKDKKVKELQDNVAAVNFTPQSKMGKMLMAKCRTLQEENEDVGQLHSEGKIHELTMKLALQKSQNAELRNQCEGLYKCMDGLTNDVEKSNEMEGLHVPLGISSLLNRVPSCSGPKAPRLGGRDPWLQKEGDYTATEIRREGYSTEETKRGAISKRANPRRKRFYCREKCH